MAEFFAELKRRNIYRVAAAYVLVAWLLLQVVNNLAPGLNLPNSAVTLVIVFLAIGFPIALLFAWIHELPPEGAAPKPQTTRLDYVLASALMLVIALVSYQQLAPRGERAAQLGQADIAAARQASLSPASAVSIAVLPFANLSADPEQEFFSDGMTDEISATLAKIPDLRVVGRSSAFQFKDTNQDLRAIGQALGATHLIEGSVRKAGDRLRITAQFVQAENGLQLWTENYDRNLADVFAVQEDIAKAIAASFGMTLGLRPGEMLVSNRIADPAIYEEYLRGKNLLRDNRGDANEALANLVLRAPDFAPGWAARAEALRASTNPAMRVGDFKLASALLDQAEAAAKRAIALDPSHVGGYSALASTLGRRGKWAEAIELYQRAYALDPNEPEMLHAYSTTLNRIGRNRESLVLRERLMALEPLVGLYNGVTARIMQANGKIDESIPILEKVAGNGPQNVTLAEAYAIKGRFDDAADALLRITIQFDRRPVEEAARLLRAAPSKTAAPQDLPALPAELGFVYIYAGAPERALEYPERAVREGNFGPMDRVWVPAAAPLRQTERFKTLMRDAGLVAYWRARGWPDLCRPLGTDDFVCD